MLKLLQLGQILTIELRSTRLSEGQLALPISAGGLESVRIPALSSGRQSLISADRRSGNEQIYIFSRDGLNTCVQLVNTHANKNLFACSFEPNTRTLVCLVLPGCQRCGNDATKLAPPLRPWQQGGTTDTMSLVPPPCHRHGGRYETNLDFGLTRRISSYCGEVAEYAFKCNSMYFL